MVFGFSHPERSHCLHVGKDDFHPMVGRQRWEEKNQRVVVTGKDYGCVRRYFW
jgi:hypothetical protein